MVFLKNVLILPQVFYYSRVWNKRTPLNKRSPLENLAKRIIVAPFLPYTMKSGIRPQPLEKSQKINNRRATFIPDSRVVNFNLRLPDAYLALISLIATVKDYDLQMKLTAGLYLKDFGLLSFGNLSSQSNNCRFM